MLEQLDWQRRLRKVPSRSLFFYVPVGGLLLGFVVSAFIFQHFTNNYDNFVYQADGFLHGSVFYHTLPPILHDSSVVNGQYYWAPGPLPAVLLMPIVAIFGLARAGWRVASSRPRISGLS